MRAAVIRAFGGVEGLSVEDVDRPVPDLGMALVQVEASSIAFADTLTRRGMYPPGLTGPGFITGGEAVGRVVSVGGHGEHELVGSRVYAANGLGCHAEFVSLPLAGLMPLPEDIDPKAAVAFGVTSVVAKAALDRAGIGPRKDVLVRGAAGGVGLAVVQLALLAGAQVIATSSSNKRAEFLLARGVSQVLDRQGLSPSGDRPSCDIVIDPVAGEDLTPFLAMLATNGHYILIGGAGGLPTHDFGNFLISNFFKSTTFSTLSLHAVSLPDRAAAFGYILSEYQAGRLAPDIDMVISLDEIRDAHRRIEANENRGRIIVEF